MSSRVIAVLLCLCSLAAAEDRWLRVRTPNLTVFSNASESQARSAAMAFEQFRYVFSQNRALRLDTSADLVVLVARDEATMKKLVPHYWERKGAKPAGVFIAGWERDYALVGSYFGERSSEVVYHEYVHKVLRANLRKLPLWLNEGLAEFFSNARFTEKHVQIGLPSPRLGYLRSRPLIAAEELMDAGYGSKFYTREDEVGRFYAQSWAFTHFLTFGEGMGKGAKLNEFIARLQQRGKTREAFEETFGPLKEIHKKFDNYIRLFAFYGFRLENPAQLNEKDFGVEKISSQEAQAVLGAFHVRQRNLDSARALLSTSIAAEPKNAEAREALGFLALKEGKLAEASAAFAGAVEVDATRYLAAFYRAIIEFNAGRMTSSAYMQAMQSILSQEPKFAPAAVELARELAKQSKHEPALAAMMMALKAEPNRAGYYAYIARIYERAGDGKNAAEVAKLVVDRWEGPDRYEAMEILERVDPAALKGVRSADEEMETTSMRGRLKRVTCAQKELPLFEVETATGSTTFSGKNFIFGFSDTFWFGADHFSYCNYVEGLPTVVRFKAKTDSGARELRSIEFRDELPPPELVEGGG